MKYKCSDMRLGPPTQISKGADAPGIAPSTTLKSFIKSKLFGDEVYYTDFLILLVKNMPCSELHCLKVLIQLPFHVKSQGADDTGGDGGEGGGGEKYEPASETLHIFVSFQKRFHLQTLIICKLGFNQNY